MSCGHCDDNWPIYSGKNPRGFSYLTGTLLVNRVWDHNDALHSIDYSVNYCPMCGASLPEPKPLTLDELRARVGEPVYIVDDDYTTNNGWVIWTDHHVEYWLDIPGNGECCGTIWRAYDRPPKEDAHA